MSGEPACRTHPEATAIDRCVGCSASICRLCMFMDERFRPVCESCLQKNRLSARRLRVAKVCALAIAAAAAFYAGGYVLQSRGRAFDYAALGGKVRRLNGILEKEPCDRRAIIELAALMAEAGNHRGVIDSATGFFAVCGDYPQLRWATYGAFKTLSEFDAAANEATKLIESDPYEANFRGWRGLAYEMKGDLDRAAEDFRQALALKPTLADVSMELASIQEKRGMPCEAIFPIEQALYYYPAATNAASLRQRVEALYKTGSCGVGTGKARIRASPGARAITTRAKVNGADVGTFVVDTGASYVTLSAEYAARLKLSSPAATVLISTAGGVRSGQLLTLDSVRVQDLEATRVPAVILSEIGPGIDGLLGLSFLGRFDLHQSEGMIELHARR